MSTASGAGRDRDRSGTPSLGARPALGDLRDVPWGYVLRRTVREFLRDRGNDLAAALTYYAVLAVIPALIALVSMLSLVGQAESTAAALLDLVATVAPGRSIDALRPAIEQVTRTPAPGVGLAIGLAFALWTASNYVAAFGRAMNRVYGIEEGRPLWKLRPQMYGLTALLLVLVSIAALILAVSGPIARRLGEIVGLGDAVVTAWNIGKWPVLLVILIVVTRMLYAATPNVHRPKMPWVTPGAVLAIGAAAIATAGFGVYVANFARYNATYGTLAGIIIFLVWIWVMNLALLFGAEFDAELERVRQLRGGIEAERRLRFDLRDTRAIARRAEWLAADVEQGRRLRRLRSEGRSRPQSRRVGPEVPDEPSD